MTIRRIAAVTTSRADWSHLRWVCRAIRERPELELSLLVTAAHLAPEFGSTVEEIRSEGFQIYSETESLLSSDSDVGMAKTIGVATLGLADSLGRLRPDLLLLIADRYEMLAPAAVGLALRIPMAHIEGGEISEGAIDDAVRHALTKLCHLHFTPTARATRRVLALGEEPWRVHHVGAPSLDQLSHATLLDRQELEHRLGCRLSDGPRLLIAYHPVTIHHDPAEEADGLFAALEPLASQCQLLFCFPNADAGSRQIISRTKSLLQRLAAPGVESSPHRLFINLPPAVYWSLLSQVSALIGNSSSGIMETPSLKVPTVNIGDRQFGRERALNIIDVSPGPEAIQAGIARARSETFRRSLVGMTSPYGDGGAGHRIADILTRCPLGPPLLRKRTLLLPEDSP